MKQLIGIMIVLLGLGNAMTVSASTVAPVNTTTMPSQLVFKEGQHYQRAPKEITEQEVVKDLLKEAQQKIQVIEFFSYACHWCYKVDPYIEKWRQQLPKGVSFIRIPVQFQPSWAALSKAYYTEMTLNAFDKIHSPFFEAIQNNRFPDASDEAIKQFFIQRGVKAEDFTKTFHSFEVTRSQKWAEVVTKAYRIMGVPAFIVQGPKGSFITTLAMAGNEANVVNVINYLITLEHSAP